jgi:acid phosphatase type 7
MRFLKPVCALVAIAAAVPSGSAAPRKPIGILLVAGDIAKCDPEAARDEATAEVVRRAVVDAQKRRIPVRVVVLGDLAYERGTPEEFKCFDSSWGQFKSIMLPVPGNHEYSYRGGEAAEGYYEYFQSAPLVSGKPLVEMNGDDTGYYSLAFPDRRRGAWRLIGLNAYLPKEEKARQLQWLHDQLKANRAPCVIAFWHPHVVSSGQHGREDSGRNMPVPNRQMLDAFTALHGARATALLTGHDHNFEQFTRLDPAGRKDSGGVRTFVVGTGGARLRPVKQPSRWPSSEAFDDKANGVLQIRLFRDRYDWSFLPAEGETAPVLPVASDRCNGRR